LTLPAAVRQSLVVLRKELIDALRDRRALVSILISVLFAPAIMAFAMNRVADREREAEEIRVPIVGRQNAPALVAWLGQQAGVQVATAFEGDPEAAVRRQVEDVVLVIPPEFAAEFRASRPATVRIVADNSRNLARTKVERVRRLMQRYNAEIGSLRLIARGVSPAVATPLQIQAVEVSSAQQRAAVILGVIPMFILVAAFTGGMQIATDATAGERERGSLEPLLVNPAPRGAIVAGKWLAATLAAMVTVVLSAVLCLLLLRLVPLQDLGVRFRLSAPQLAGILLALIPLCPLTAAAQACIATFARSFKEAQSYMAILIMAATLPAILGSLYPLTSRAWMYPVPMVGQYALLTNVIAGKTPGPLAFIGATITALLAAAVFLRVTTSLFRSERILFAR
jgi:sodium transport system permease protein